MIAAQQFGQLARVDAIALVAGVEQGILARIADHQVGDVRPQQIVEPGGAGALFKGHMQRAPQPRQELENGGRFGLQQAFHHQLAALLQDRDRDRCLMHVQANILRTVHQGAPFVGCCELPLTTYSQGAPFYNAFTLIELT
jgi:hypothetical protein